MATRTKTMKLSKGRPRDAKYDKMAERAMKLKLGKYFTAAKCDNDEEAIVVRGRISSSIRVRVKMPKGLRLAYCRTDDFNVQIWCVEV